MTAGNDFDTISAMSPSEFAARLDHSVLKPEATRTQVLQAVADALAHRFAAVCVAPCWMAVAKKELGDGPVLACGVAGFPHGTAKPVIKAIEASSLMKDGADEVDVVMHLPNLIELNFDAARSELMEIVRAVRAVRRDGVLKAIIESALLLKMGTDGRGEEMIAMACRAARESGCDFVKTSTGYHPAGGASVEAVMLMRKHAQGLLIKASGGITDLPKALALLEAGADRLGTSASVALVEAMKQPLAIGVVR
jgi:deoxyribose-phosphate aldolase